MRNDGRERLTGWGAAVAALAFAAVLVGFGFEIIGFRHAVEQWARRDLRNQAELAAANLEEPLKTQDFRRMEELHRTLGEKDMVLRVRSSNGGWIFRGGYEGPALEEYAPSGEYQVGVAVRAAQVYAPFRRALRGFALAALVGTLGMSVIFFVLYRQRMRIRELAKLEKFRREFIADVSHEIRTPLTGIMGAADMMEGDSPLAAMIKKESARLDALVQRILDLSRLERGEEKPDFVDFDLSELVREVAGRTRTPASGADGSVAFRGDPRLIGEALGNLIANAERHSGSDEISVTLKTEERRVELIVEDRGVGVPPEHAARIFERFYRVDPARAAASGGAGLGLAIVRRIARLHGGEATYEPAIPRGSRFLLSLPRGILV